MRLMSSWLAMRGPSHSLMRSTSRTSSRMPLGVSVSAIWGSLRFIIFSRLRLGACTSSICSCRSIPDEEAHPGWSVLPLLAVACREHPAVSANAPARDNCRRRGDFAVGLEAGMMPCGSSGIKPTSIISALRRMRARCASPLAARGAAAKPAWLFPAAPALALSLARRLAHHALELEPVRVEEEHGIVAFAVVWIVGGRIDHGDAVLLQQRVEVVDVAPLAQLEGVVVEADVADAVRVLLALRVGLADPEQGLAVAPAGGLVEVVLALESEEAQHRVVEPPRAREVLHADDEVVDADDAGRHGCLRSTPPPPCALRAPST